MFLWFIHSNAKSTMQAKQESGAAKAQKLPAQRTKAAE